MTGVLEVVIYLLELVAEPLLDLLITLVERVAKLLSGLFLRARA